MSEIQTDYTKFVLDWVYVTHTLAKQLVERGIATADPYNKRLLYEVNIIEGLSSVRWDLVNGCIQVLLNTVATAEDDLATQLMMMPDDGVRLIYLNNL